MRRSTPQPISDVLKDVVEKLSQAKRGDVAKIFAVWGTCAGKQLARHTRPTQLRKGTLKVLVDDSAWFYQANLQRERLLQSLQRKMGAEKVQKIQFSIGK